MSGYYAQQQAQQSKKQLVKTITGCVNNGSGLIRVTATNHKLRDNDHVVISSVVGTVEANGTWFVTFVNANAVDLKSSTFTNAYTSGGTLKRI